MDQLNLQIGIAACLLSVVPTYFLEEFADTNIACTLNFLMEILLERRKPNFYSSF